MALETDVVTTLIKQRRTITTMESCTAGLIASMLTDTEGASAIFQGGFVTYSNEAKVQAGVEKAVIETYGVYSRECASAMARVAKAWFHTDIAIGVTGTTGNVDPENADSVRGVMYYSIIIDETIYPYEYHAETKKLIRKEIKQLYAREVFRSLKELL